MTIELDLMKIIEKLLKELEEKDSQIQLLKSDYEYKPVVIPSTIPVHYPTWQGTCIISGILTSGMLNQ